MKEMFEAVIDGQPVGIFPTEDEAKTYVENHLANEPTATGAIRQIFVGDKNEAIKPNRPTIADTGWKDEYKGMWAEHKVTNKVFLMLDDDEERVRCFDSHSNMWGVKNESLIPRPDLAPVNLTPHPTYLETLEDYENAPVDTVIGSKWVETCPTLVKDVRGKWVSVGRSNSRESANLAGDRRRVLYWPEEEE